jgi:hypothetical protein
MNNRLIEIGKVALDAAGNGQLVMRPQRAGESWRIRNTAVSCTGNLPTNGIVSQVLVFQGFPGGVAIEGTYNVLQDSSDTIIEIGEGNCISFTWTNGPFNGTATVTLTGDRITGGG